MDSRLRPSDILHTLDLAFNPFEPAASGPPVGIAISPPQALAARMHSLLDTRRLTRGHKVFVIIGDYGTGKTCLLRWLHDLLPARRVRPFYFDNARVHFNDLANSLLQTIGRKDFATFIWELARSHASLPDRGSLFRKSFEDYLSAESRPGRGRHHEIAGSLRAAIMNAGVTSDEEIARCLAGIVTDAVRKPYFEYRDFLPRRTDSLVAEAEEARYFGAILKTLSRGSGADAVAFLIDEFEEVGLQKRLARRAAHDYLSTLKRLTDLTRKQDNQFWLFLSMPPDAYQTTQDLEPGLVELRDSVLRLEPLQPDDAVTLIATRLNAARPPHSTNRNGRNLFPFPEDIPFSPDTRSNPRRLVKACSFAISAADVTTNLPFSRDYLQGIEAKLFLDRAEEDA